MAETGGGAYETIGFVFDAKGITSFVKSMDAAAGSVAAMNVDAALMTSTVSALAGGMLAVGKAAYKLGSAMGRPLRHLMSFEKIGSFFGKSGGIFGLLLGPFRPLLRLLTPIIGMLTKTLLPAIELFTGIVENAFAPLQELFSLFAMQLGRIVTKHMAPFVEIIQLGALYLGSLVLKFFEGGKAGSMFTSVLSGLGSAFSFVYDFITGIPSALSSALLAVWDYLKPLKVWIFDKLLLPLKDAAGFVAAPFIAIGNALKPLFKALMPLLHTLFTKFLGPATLRVLVLWKDALVAYYTMLFKIGKFVVTNILGPVVMGALKVVVGALKVLWDLSKRAFKGWVIIADTVIKPFAAWLAPWIDTLNMSLNLWFENFGSYIRAIPSLFMDAFNFVKQKVGDFMVFLGLDKVGDALSGVFGYMKSALLSPFEALKALLNVAIIGPLNKLFEVSFAGFSIGGAVSALGVTVPIKEFAAGGIVTGPTTGLIGEAGPELVLPLKPSVIEQAMGPVIPKMMMPGLDRVVGVLERIDDRLGGTLRVDGVGSSDAGVSGDLGLAVGMAGV